MEDRIAHTNWQDCDDPKKLRDELRHIYTLLWDTVKANDIKVHHNENPAVAIGRKLCMGDNKQTKVAIIGEHMDLSIMEGLMSKMREADHIDPSFIVIDSCGGLDIETEQFEISPALYEASRPTCKLIDTDLPFYKRGKGRKGKPKKDWE